MKRNILLVLVVLAMALVMAIPTFAGGPSCDDSSGHPVGPGGNARSSAACAKGDMPLVISIHRGAGLDAYGQGNGNGLPTP